MLRADLHIHTCYSMDSAMKLEEVIERCLKTGINCIAVADHGVIGGAVKLKEMAPFPVIVAEEILTHSGEVMGLFLTEEIPSNMSVRETIVRIKDQGGLVCIPHPFDRIRMSAFRNQMLEEFLPDIDIIEVFNSRNLFPGASAKARGLAQKYGLAGSAGSDAHTPGEIGNAYVEMPEFDGRDDFLESLVRGKVFGSKSNPMVHFASTWKRLGSIYRG